ncbi:MAG: hypothetical protein K6G42_09335 [Lachnospiraceae bacterium]|nr:hypothetical protein [Lachnospiraceae bacterium]
MKRSLYPLIECLLVLALVTGLLFVTSRLVENKASYNKYNEFYKYGDEYEVLFSGSSHMMNMALPMELWKKYGIRSYNIGNGAETIPVTYHVIRNALDHSSPKVIVMDVFYAYSDQTVSDSTSEMAHAFFDEVPFSFHKAEAICDIFEDAQERWNYLFDFSIYHSRWNELTKADLFPEDAGLGGASILLESYAPAGTQTDPPELHEMARVPREYLMKIKELCDEKGIRLVCVMNPYPMWQEKRTCNVDFEKEMNEMGIEFIDLRESDAVDIYADSADNMHLNLCGERKINDVYGEYLTGIGCGGDHDPSDEIWKGRYEAYIRKKAMYLSGCDECVQLLTDLNDPDMVYDITVGEDAALTDTMRRMLKNAKDYENVSIATADVPDGDIRIRVRIRGADRDLVDKSFDL